MALHQAGMVERMAEDYDKALELFLQEAEVIYTAYPEDDLRIAANLYEQAITAFELTGDSIAVDEVKAMLVGK